MKPFWICIWAALLTAATLSGGEPAPLISQPGRVLLEENFAGAALPKNWQPGGRPHSFTIVDGALQGQCPADDGHGPSIGVPLEGHNWTIQFSMRSVKPGVMLLLVDGESQYGGAAHLLRFASHGDGTALQQDRGTLESKQQQAKARAQATAEGRKVPPPTAPQLADPKFYRTEPLATNPAKLQDGKWHTVLIEIRGNDVVAQVDGTLTLRAKGTVLDVKKSRLVFLVGAAGCVQFDNVKVWENEPLAVSGSRWQQQAAEDAKQDRTTIAFDGQKPDSMVCDTTLRELPDGSWALFMLAGDTFEPSPKNYTGLTRSRDSGKTWSPLEAVDIGFPRAGKTSGQGPTELMILGQRCTLFFSTHSQTWGRDWRSWMMHSDDNCRTWSKPLPVPGRLANFTFIRNHIVCRDGRIMLPFQHYVGPGPDVPPPPADERPWHKSLAHYVSNPRNGVLISSDGGQTWSEHGNVRLTTDDRYHGWAENNIVELADGRIAMIIRGDRLGGVLYYAESRDGGRTWPEFAQKTDIPNPGSKATLYGLGGDTVALLHNPNPKHRSPMALWISFDGMQTWPYRRVLVPESCDGPQGRMNYPDGFVSKDKQYLHFAFDDNRHRAVYYGAKLPPLK